MSDPRKAAWRRRIEAMSEQELAEEIAALENDWRVSSFLDWKLDQCERELDHRI